MNRFLSCTSCNLSKFRRKVVFGRGKIPAQVLFIGEAPGKVEDIKGEAFVGRSGKLLDDIICDAWKLTKCPSPVPSFYITNTTACRPTDRTGGENREPLPEEILACRNRLFTTLKLVNPKIAVFVGKIAEKYYRSLFPEAFSIFHPSYLLRGGGKEHPDYLLTVRKLHAAFQYLNSL
jgi:uracil-DNA glycosylase